MGVKQITLLHSYIEDATKWHNVYFFNPQHPEKHMQGASFPQHSIIFPLIFL